MKNKKGFTLIEIIVTLAIFAILIGGSSSLLLTGNDIFKKQANMSYGSNMAQSTMSWLEDNVAYASDIIITDSTATIPSGVTAIKVQNTGSQEGQLMIYENGAWQEVFTPGVYDNWKIHLNPLALGNRIELNVEITDLNNTAINQISKTITLKNYRSLIDQRTDFNNPYPMFLLSSDTPTPELPDEDTSENTPEVFYIGGDPEYPVPSNGDILGYVESKDPSGTNIPDGSIYYDLGGYVTPYGETLSAGYYITRWGQYLTPTQAADPDYVYRYLYGVYDTKGNGEIKYKNKQIDSNPNYFIRTPVYKSAPYGQLININVDPNNIPEPSRYTQPGDLRREGDDFYVFFPQKERYWQDYDPRNSINWIKIDSSIMGL
jgi:prepilin-type N-terminal cleavage/methylation domain-containing protein